MRLILVALTVVLFSCMDTSETETVKPMKLSRAQLFLNNLRDSLNVEYAQQSSEQTRNEVLKKYHERLQTYLM